MELLRRRKARADLTEYARFIEVPGAPLTEADDEEQFKPVETVLAQHHELILSATQRCIERHSGRTMLFLPPGSAKSTYATVVGPTWIMGQRPGFKVIGVSYGSDLARKFGRRMRSIVKQPAFKTLFDTTLSTESSAADEWALENGSEFMGGGILSGITGNRADFAPIDDPIKGRQEADSEVTQKRTLEAYQDDVLTRLKPGGSVMVTQTRWNENDLAGSILPENYAGESGMIECRDGNTWEVICIPAQAERADDPLGRKIGEYIWPEWFPEDHWQTFKRIPRTWSALYQQRPSPEEGDYFKADWFKPVHKLPDPKTLRVYGGSDYAVTADGGDYTVHVVIGVDPEERIYILDIWRKQASSEVWIEAFCDLVLAHKPMGWAEETGQIRAGVGPFLTKRQRERGAYCYREQFPTRGDKAVRAQSIRGRAALSGIYYQADAPWWADLRSEMLSFPAGKHDDQCVAEGTAISMADGSCLSIEDVRVGDFVATPSGPCMVTASRVTNEKAKVFKVTTSGGRELTATGNHPVYVENKGFVRIDELSMMDQIRLEPSCIAGHQKLKSSNIEETDIGAILTGRPRLISVISTPLNRVVDSFIGIFGKMLTAQFLPAMISTTGTGTGTIIRSKTSSVSQEQSIADATPWSVSGLFAKSSTLNGSGQKHRSGIQVMRGRRGTPSMASKLGTIGRLSVRCARRVAMALTHHLSERCSVRVDASSEASEAALPNAVGLWPKARQFHASAAHGSSQPNGRTSRSIAPKHAGCVIAVEALSSPARVLNLTVNQAHVFYANGMLTHNCDALGLVGQLLDRMLSGEKPRPTTKPVRDRYDRDDDEGAVDWKTA